MFAVRNRFANPQTKTLSPQFADLRTGLRKCPALQSTSGRVDRSSAPEAVDSGSIPCRVKQKSINIGIQIHSFPP